jgi:hypothetical protein
MRHAGSELDLQFAERARPLTGNYDGYQAGAEHKQNSECQGEIPRLFLLDSALE